MNILIRIERVYGRTLIYPACPLADAFAKLTGKKTLSVKDLDLIKTLGINVTQIQEKLYE